jgi:hypothetical protein
MSYGLAFHPRPGMRPVNICTHLWRAAPAVLCWAAISRMRGKKWIFELLGRQPFAFFLQVHSLDLRRNLTSAQLPPRRTASSLFTRPCVQKTRVTIEAKGLRGGGFRPIQCQ